MALVHSNWKVREAAVNVFTQVLHLFTHPLCAVGVVVLFPWGWACAASTAGAFSFACCATIPTDVSMASPVCLLPHTRLDTSVSNRLGLSKQVTCISS